MIGVRIACVIAALVGLVAPVSAADDEAEIRDLLRRYADARTAGDVETSLALHADTVVIDGDPLPRETFREQLAWERANPAMIPIMSVDRAEVRIDGSRATVEPIVRGEDETVTVRMSLRRTGAGWRITEMDRISTGAIEAGLPFVDSAYVSLAERWAEANLATVRAVLRANPPDTGDPRLRRQALLMLDEPLHLRSAPYREPVGRFLRDGIDQAIAEMRSERMTEGATIWKLYNLGFVVRTASATWAHDLNPGYGNAVMSDAQVDAILGEIDALFVSHWHADHAPFPIIRRAAEKGVPVFLPPLPAGGNGDFVRREIGSMPATSTIVAPGTGGEIAGIQYHAYPGHQGELENHLFLIESGGMTILHTGDQTNADDYPIIDRIGSEHAVDVLLPHVLQNYVRRIADGVRPRCVVPGHECELGHGFESREPYDQAYRVVDGKRAWIIMTWGERTHVSGRY